MATETLVRKWGNSLGVILPKELVEERHLREKDKILVEVVKEADLTEIYGSLPRKISGQKFKNMVRQGWER